jgi:hypothetical protein
VASPDLTGRHPGTGLDAPVLYAQQQGFKGAEMAAQRANGNGKKKVGRLARRIARIERRTLRLMMIPVILIAQRRMMKTLERVV